jgi:hypothetical protein
MARQLHMHEVSLPSLAAGLRSWISSEGNMAPTTFVETAICEGYDRLVAECEAARQAWNERRAEIWASGKQGKETDHELRCLQAKYAKSIAILRSHLRDGQLCQSA